uniref:Protein kinase domain-containing protein n=1 Tax=Arundo donax TaxID=35708 RepID=A0A0A8ZSA8_ARUDO
MNVYKQHDEKADIFSAGIVYYYLFVPQVDGRKDKVTQLSTSIREQIQEFDNQGKDFDLDIVLDGTNVLTDWRGSLPLLKRMTKPKANERPSASEILDLMQLHGIGSENFGFLLR